LIERVRCSHQYDGHFYLQATTGLADTVVAETAGLADKKMPILEGKWLVLFPGFEDTTALENKKV